MATTADAAQRELLSGVQVQAAQLPGSMIGWASDSSPTIYVDLDAAGHGWFVDKYEGQSTKDEVGALAASGRMDLVSVLAHELGHILGEQHADPDVHALDVMAAELAPGTRLRSAAQWSDKTFEMRGQESAVGSQKSEDFRFPISDFRFLGEIADLSQRSPFDGSNDLHPGSRIPDLASRISDLASGVSHPASRVTDAFFGRLADRAAVITDDYDSLMEQDDSSDEAEDGLDLWSLLYGLQG
jgi:hypothetical protein